MPEILKDTALFLSNIHWFLQPVNLLRIVLGCGQDFMQPNTKLFILCLYGPGIQWSCCSAKETFLWISKLYCIQFGVDLPHFCLLHMLKTKVLSLIGCTCCPHSSSLTAHQARTSLRTYEMKSRMDVCCCLSSTHATAATSVTTTAPRRPTSTLLTWSTSQEASPETGGRTEVIPTISMKIWPNHFPQAHFMPLACAPGLNWARDATDQVLFR